MIFTRVDFPAPLSPIRPSTSPGSSDRSTSVSARIAPKCFETFLSSRMGKAGRRPFEGRCDERDPRVRFSHCPAARRFAARADRARKRREIWRRIMALRPLGDTGLRIEPLVFGANVFGWTVDQKGGFDLLDTFVDAGLNAIDTADVYSAWAPGNQGGESETVIGNWLKANPGKREKVLIFTKVGSPMPGGKGLSERWIMRAVEDSLRRLQTDRIDLYQSHWLDPDTPYAETLGAYAKLLQAGKIRAIGASNLNAAQLAEALRVARENGLPAYRTLQPEYNLYDRSGYDGDLRDLCIREKLGVITYYSLASGFLSGQYRSEADLAQSPRGARVKRYLNPRGERILAALDAVAARHAAAPAEVALAWLIAREGVTAPIASATNRRQLASLVNATRLELSPDDIAALDTASE